MSAPGADPVTARATPSAAGEPRVRVISDNDYAGDPDGLYQLAHLMASPSVVVPAVVGSHLAVGDPFDPSGRSAARAVARAERVLELMGRTGTVPVVAGSELGLSRAGEPRSSAATEVILAEAMRTDTDLPLFLTLGGGLTELANALLVEPAVADRLTAVWIGGPEHPGLGASPPPGAAPVEYNLNIDPVAAQVVFDSRVPLWQVPRDAYRQVLVSTAELVLRARRHGVLGAHLLAELESVRRRAGAAGHRLGETYCLGDNPLVLLTALQSAFEPDPASSRYTELARPGVSDRGDYLPRPDGAPMRVYTQLDTRLLVEDLFAKLELLAGR